MARFATPLLFVCTATAILNGSRPLRAIEWIEWTSIQYPGAVGTSVYDLEGPNLVCGTYVDAALKQHAFVYDGKDWTSIDDPGATSTEARGISGNRVAIQTDGPDGLQGYIYENGTWTPLPKPAEVPGAEIFAIRGSDIYGIEWLTNQGTRGFHYDGTTWKSFTHPDATTMDNTWFQDGQGGRIVGSLLSSDIEGLILDGSVWSAFDYPGSTASAAWSIDGANIVGQYADAAGKWHGYMFDGTNWTTLDYPGAMATYPTRIRGNRLLGIYLDQQGLTHQFLATIPEPSTLLVASVGIGLFSGSVMRNRKLRTSTQYSSAKALPRPEPDGHSGDR